MITTTEALFWFLGGIITWEVSKFILKYIFPSLTSAYYHYKAWGLSTFKALNEILFDLSFDYKYRRIKNDNIIM